MEAAASTASKQRGNSNLEDISQDRAGLELEMEPCVSELSPSSEEDEGLKDTVGSGPSGCSNWSKRMLSHV